jgi:uncharacterized protein
MSLASRVAARAAHLGPAALAEVVVERDLEASMPDGAVLLADRWYSPHAIQAPIVLIRSPYGRRPLGLLGRLFAERGYQVVIQSCRGTFGSGGAFEPFTNEPGDGAATLAWVADQPWFTGTVGTFGPSYLGLTQWAVAGDPPDYLRAMALQVTAARVRDVIYPGGAFGLESGGFWVRQIHFQELGTRRTLAGLLAGRRRAHRDLLSLPLSGLDQKTLGQTIGFYQDWLAHELVGDPWWDSSDWSGAATGVPAASLLGGWYDLFLPGQIEDFVRLRRAGREARLTIGPWTHASPRSAGAGLRDGLEWFDIHLKGRPAGQDDGAARVRLYVLGSGRWVHLPDWPPPAITRAWYLHAGHALSTDQPAPGRPDRYRYDPADPTPGYGGPSLDPFRAGPRDQRRRESRPDVLTYTTAPLTADLTVAGPVAADLWIRSSRPHGDVFARLCDVDGSGRSRHVCDGLVRIDPDQVVSDQEGIRHVRVPLWPTAITFRSGHRIRLQVSSAAHPLYSRNLGGGERLAGAVTAHRSDHELFHDPDHPSAIELPVSSI